MIAVTSSLLLEQIDRPEQVRWLGAGGPGWEGLDGEHLADGQHAFRPGDAAQPVDGGRQPAQGKGGADAERDVVGAGLRGEVERRTLDIAEPAGEAFPGRLLAGVTMEARIHFQADDLDRPAPGPGA